MPATKILEKTASYHRKQQSLCIRLEAVADGLPGKVDRQECLTLARDIYPSVREAHDFEERELFPYLTSNAGSSALSKGLERLRFEHWEDEAYAEEISDTLHSIGRGEVNQDPEKTCWMLRGFFDGLRRHIAFEAEHLMPLLKSERAA